jgi:hypothetical protein
MADTGKDELRRFVTRLLDAFVSSIERQQKNQSIAVGELPAMLRAFERSATLGEEIEAAYRRLKDQAAHELLRNRRMDPFNRLLVHPFTEHLESGALPREMLDNYFNFLHLVLGDETVALARLCVTICRDTEGEDGVNWDAFYADERAKFVLWTALARIAASFRRFDVRREWFIGLMQNRQASVSLASNAFLALPPEDDVDKPYVFGAEQFNILFGALFGPLKRLDIEDEAAFAEAIGSPVKQLFGTFWQDLERAGAML